MSNYEHGWVKRCDYVVYSRRYNYGKSKNDIKGESWQLEKQCFLLPVNED